MYCTENLKSGRHSAILSEINPPPTLTDFPVAVVQSRSFRENRSEKLSHNPVHRQTDRQTDKDNHIISVIVPWQRNAENAGVELSGGDLATMESQSYYISC